MLLPEIYALDVFCPSIRFCALDDYRPHCSTLLYVGLGVQSRIVLLQALCALDVCWPRLIFVRSTLIEPAVLPYCTRSYMSSPG